MRPLSSGDHVISVGDQLNHAFAAGASSTASFSGPTEPENEKEEQGVAAVAAKGEEGAEVGGGATRGTEATVPAPAPGMALPSLSSAASGGDSGSATLTTGGNALRRRFHASKSSLGGDEDLGLNKGVDSGAAGAGTERRREEGRRG
jgi:hypothetical protein